MLILLSACSGQETNGNSSDPKPSSDRGKYVTNGISDDEILIGGLHPRSGPVAFAGEIGDAVQAYFDLVNEKGGVHGRKLKYIVYDDQYLPAQSAQLAKRLVEQDKVFLVLNSTGSPTNLATKTYYEQNKVVSLMIGTGVAAFTEKPNPYYFGANTGLYKIEGQILAEHAVKQLKAKKIAVIYPSDDMGKEYLEGVKKSLANTDAEIVAEVTYAVGNKDFSSQVQHLKESQPDVIITASNEAPTAGIKKELYNQGVNAKVLVPGVAGGEKQFELVGKEAWEGTISTSQLVDNRVDPTNPLYNEYTKKLKEKYPNVNPGGTAPYGWGSAQILVEVIERAGKDLTMEKFIEALYTLDKWDGSLFAPISFSPDNHVGAISYYMTEAKDGKIVPISDPIYYDPATQKVISE
jgi:branched-chain amino acid transport system substrate-binding protein